MGSFLLPDREKRHAWADRAGSREDVLKMSLPSINAGAITCLSCGHLVTDVWVSGDGTMERCEADSGLHRRDTSFYNAFGRERCTCGLTFASSTFPGIDDDGYSFVDA